MEKRFICTRHEEIVYGFWPRDAETLAGDALRIHAEKGWAWLRLPLYPLTEGRILGAKIREGAAGAWAGEPISKDGRELPPALFRGADVDLILSTIRLLSEKPTPISLDLKGPLSVLETLTPSLRVYQKLRKDDPYLQELSCGLRDWAVSCIDAGVSLISFADPLATLDLIGEKNFLAHYWPLLKGLLQGIFSARPQVNIHLCGKLSQDLLELGLLGKEVLPMECPCPLDRALLQRKGLLSGLACLNGPSIPRTEIVKLILSE